MPRTWYFYYIDYCHQVRPTPKPKFVAIVCADNKFMGFFINSGIGKYVRKKPKLMACQVFIKKADYHFLSHDSYIDCSDLIEFENYDLTDQRDSISTTTKQEIQQAVIDAKTIPPYYKRLIVS
jgi:hypothetical protein